MKRAWLIVLALSLGLNAGLLYNSLANRPGPAPPFGGGHPPFIDHPGRPGAGGGPFEPGEFARHRMRRLAEHFDMSEKQRSEIHRIVRESLPVIIDLRGAVQEIRLALREEYGKEEPDHSTVRALVRDLNTAQGRLDSLVAETILRESELLSPEQRVHYFEAMPWEGKRPGGRRGRGRDR